jgi:iron complex outermembrane recepter protein
LLFQQPQNTDTPVKMKGFELLYQQRFDFITQGLGALLNYTRLDSGESVVVGLARDNYNATVYFERPSFAARLSYNWRADYVECTVNCFATEPLPQYRQEAGYLDLSTSYNFEAFGQKLTVSLEGLNLTDEVEYAYFGHTNRAAVFNQPGRTFLLGIRGTF